jgi:hypothetical protein
MKQFHKIFLTILFVSFSGSLLMAQKSFFSDISESGIRQTGYNRVIKPEKYRVVTADMNGLKNFLWSLPLEKDILYNRNQCPVLLIPMPDGRSASFRVWQSSIQEPALEAKFPDIKTFTGQGIDDPYATIRFDYTPRGFHAQVLTPGATYYIDPYAVGDVENYISYFRRDNSRSSSFHCDLPESSYLQRVANVTAPCRGTDLRTYRLAVACTGEYAQAPGINAGTNAATLHAAIVTTVNRVVGVYEVELAIRMVLIGNNNLIEFLNAATDPFNGNNDANTLIGESQSVITSTIGAANFDIGHTFSTGGGGLAGLGVVCSNGQKARGITGSSNPTGDNYDIDYVAHEMGHQFGGNHPMNGCGSSPNNTKYEVGSGTTIMAYAGICGAQDIQPHSDPTFHAISFDEISNYLTGTGGSCGVLTPTGNTLPVIDALANNNLSIPIRTPFTLTGTATDADNDPLTYCWEQWDLGNPGSGWNIGLTAPAGNTAPLFKSRLPKTTGSRTFPDIAVINAGYPANPPAVMNGLKGEVLSPVARPMKFKLTVRDNRAAGGGVVSSGGNGCQTSTAFQVNVVGTVPFAVTVPNGGEVWAGSSSQTVTWNVASTDAAPINVANVKITLSTDGGLTYPTTILASTANDGSETITVPGVSSTTAKIRVEAVGNIFFDISNANFTITAPPTGFTFDSQAGGTVSCGAAVSSTVTQGTTSQGGFSTPINLTASGNPAGTTVTFGTNPVTPGNSSTVTLNNTNTLAPGTYNVTVTGTAGLSVQNIVIAFTVSPGTPPSITTQPSNSAVCSGANASFSVNAPGTGLSYQWQVSTNGGGSFTNIPGATGSTYTVTSPTTAENNNQYQVVISTACASATSNAGVLTVNTAPAIGTQPINANVCSGSNNTFTVSATGSGLTYQWQVSTDGGATFTNIPGANASSYTITGITASLDGNQYHAVVSGTCPSAVTSNNVTLAVGSPPAISTQPTSQTVCAGVNAVFTSATPATGISYQWQVSTNGGTTYTNIAGATSATYTVNAPATSLSGNLYQVIISSTCAASTSNAATLTVNQVAAITTQPSNAAACLDADANLTVTATGPGITYQWQVSTDGGVTFTDVAGATGNTLSLTGVTTSMNNNQYHVVVTGTTCGSVTSSNVTLTVNQPPVVTITSDSTTVTPGNTVQLTASSTPPATAYAWLLNGSPVPGQTTGTINVPYGQAGAYSAVVVDANGCSNTSNAISIRDTIIIHTFIYPNPNNGLFYVTFEGVPYNGLPRVLSMYDSKGSRVFTKQYKITSSYQPMEVRVPYLAKGVYVVVLSDIKGKTLESGKVVIR